MKNLKTKAKVIRKVESQVLLEEEDQVLKNQPINLQINKLISQQINQPINRLTNLRIIKVAEQDLKIRPQINKQMQSRVRKKIKVVRIRKMNQRMLQNPKKIRNKVQKLMKRMCTNLKELCKHTYSLQ